MEQVLVSTFLPPSPSPSPASAKVPCQIATKLKNKVSKVPCWGASTIGNQILLMILYHLFFMSETIPDRGGRASNLLKTHVWWFYIISIKQIEKVSYQGAWTIKNNTCLMILHHFYQKTKKSSWQFFFFLFFSWRGRLMIFCHFY